MMADMCGRWDSSLAADGDQGGTLKWGTCSTTEKRMLLQRRTGAAFIHSRTTVYL